MMRYNNYHRHDHYSNIRTPDVIVKPQDYINRIIELGHTTYFTTNHGCSGNIFEAYDLCKKQNLKCVYGMEMYYTDDRHIKDTNSKTYHLVAIGLTKNAYLHINRISSLANTEGFYYKPRVDLELLLTLPKDEVVITTACVAGRLFKTEDYIEKFVKPLQNHFGNNFMLEVQAHDHIEQIEWNKKIITLSEEMNIPIIHGCDSHYIYPKDAKDRADFLLGKNMKYGSEDSFVLDYPSSETIFERYKSQGVLSEKQVEMALNNTLIFDNAEDLGFNKEIKMPTIYPDLSPEERLKKLKTIISKRWAEESRKIPKERHAEYVDGIRFEMDIIEKTNEEVKTADYFLINEKIIDLGVNKYKGTLTRTGRGSAVSFYMNKLLGFTEIDRFDAEVPLYPTRFISVSRLLEAKSLADIDFNVADPMPFIQASKEILGDDGVYYMVAYGTMKESSSFRNLCRARNLDMKEYNEVAKNLDKYADDEKWGSIIEDSKKFVGVIDSISPSPCSFLLLDKPISEEIGLIKVGDEICCCIDGYTSDVWKYLKNDILTVSVWDIISETFNLIDKPIPTIAELRTQLDNKVWNLYRDGITTTLNQVDSDWATGLVKRYSPKSPAELTAFVAAIRPSFATLLEGFLNRIDYTTGTPELDNLLESSFHYLLYQENLMMFFTWLGIEEDLTYGLIKQIAKKKMTEEEVDNLEKTLHKNWIDKVGNDDQFHEAWDVVQNSTSYLFNSSHAYSVAWDSLYGAYLKANYPLEYYTVILNKYSDDTEKTRKIIQELAYFNIKQATIKFRFSQSGYSFDKATNTIYKGIASIKYLNDKIAEQLYEIGKNQYNSFVDLLVDITENTSCNSKQIKILIALNFFKEFGGNQMLMDVYEKFSDRYKKTHKETTKLKRLEEVVEFATTCENKPVQINLQIENELEYLGYIETKDETIPSDYVMVTELENRFKNYTATLYRVKDGTIAKIKIKAKDYNEDKFEKGDMIKLIQVNMEGRWKTTENGGWKQDHDDKEPILKRWSFVKFE